MVMCGEHWDPTWSADISLSTLHPNQTKNRDTIDDVFKMLKGNGRSMLKCWILYGVNWASWQSHKFEQTAWQRNRPNDKKVSSRSLRMSHVSSCLVLDAKVIVLLPCIVCSKHPRNGCSTRCFAATGLVSCRNRYSDTILGMNLTSLQQ
jgi:hypothetical protein